MSESNSLTNSVSLEVWSARYLMARRLKNYSVLSIDGDRRDMRKFIRWCHERELYYPQEITPPILTRYRRYLFQCRKQDGQPLSQRTQRAYLVPLRGFFSWLTREKVLHYNPASELELPRMPYTLPQHLLSTDEVELILNHVDITAPLGLRNRAMLETLYSTGIRRQELSQLAINDIDLDQGMVMVRQGKGQKDRRIPIGDRALFWLEQYLRDQRPYIRHANQTEWLFISTNGLPLHPANLGVIVRRYIDAAGIEKVGCCHLFRHSMATAMLENGADIRFIQQMLGHADLKSTQIYTQVSNQALKAVHSKTHPAKMQRKATDEEKNEDE